MEKTYFVWRSGLLTLYLGTDASPAVHWVLKMLSRHGVQEEPHPQDLMDAKVEIPPRVPSIS